MAATPMRRPTPTVRRQIKPGELINKILFYILVLIILIYTIFPFYWAIVTSLKQPARLFDTPVNYLPYAFTLENYRQAYSNPNFLPALRNSTIITLVTVGLSLMLGSFAAYAMGRLKFRGRTFILYLTLSMTMFPAIAIVGSLYQLVVRFNMYNTLSALILSYIVFTLPFTVWTLTNFFKAMPGELEEAALVDGATPFQTFYKVLLPLAAPGLVTTGLLAFIGAWNEFLFALTFTQDYRARTAVVFVGTFAGEQAFSLPWGSIMALSVTLTIPLIVLVLFFQRRIIAGLTAGAVKG
jgi:trehalose/maltose transport system permease protein